MQDSEWTSKGHIAALCTAVCVCRCQNWVSIQCVALEKKKQFWPLVFLKYHPIPLSSPCGLSSPPPLHLIQSEIWGWCTGLFHSVLLVCWPQGGPPSACVGHYWRPAMQCPWTLSLHHSSLYRCLHLTLCSCSVVSVDLCSCIFWLFQCRGLRQRTVEVVKYVLWWQTFHIYFSF